MPLKPLIALLLSAMALCVLRYSPAGAGAPASFPAATSNEGCQIQNSEPDPTCTPGAVLNLPKVQICQAGNAGSGDVPQAIQAAVYAEYGIAYPQAAGFYPLNHLIPLGLGGSNDIANLWPEAAIPFPGSQQKAALENYLHNAVCSGSIDLATAQTEIATDWVATYYSAGQPGSGG
jgi:hypothetical protein